MMNELSNRDEETVRWIVEDYLETGEPVSSQELIEKYCLQCSSATVRNSMVRLAESGYIVQPHISSGRVPLPKAYRYYVEHFLNPSELHGQQFSILEQLVAHLRENERVLEDMVHFLAQSSSQLAFGQLDDELEIAGYANLVRQPEFALDENILQVFEVLDDHERLLHLLDQLQVTTNVQFLIGEENPYRPLQTCTMVVMGYSMDGRRGALGLLGPTRFSYGLSSALLSHLSKYLSW
jgi:heat-inducible transcriptional repressor